MKAMIYGAGGGTSSDEVTALKKHVLSPYTTITNDSGDEIVAGTMVDNGAVNRSLKCGESYTIVEGFHNGSGVISADSLASQTGANAAAGDILTGKTAWVNGIKLTGTLPTMAGGTKTPSTSQITVACSGYKMTSNIVIPAFSLPTASKLLNDYTYSIYGKSVTGTAQYYVKTSTVINASSGGTFTNISGRNLVVGTTNGVKLSWGLSTTETIARTGNAFNLTNYKYVKIGGTLKYSNSSKQYLKIGVSQKADGTSITWGSQITLQGKGSDYSKTGNAIVDVTSLSGMHYIYFYLKNSSTSSSNDIDEASCTISNT